MVLIGLMVQAPGNPCEIVNYYRMMQSHHYQIQRTWQTHK